MVGPNQNGVFLACATLKQVMTLMAKQGTLIMWVRLQTLAGGEQFEQFRGQLV